MLLLSSTATEASPRRSCAARSCRCGPGDGRQAETRTGRRCRAAAPGSGAKRRPRPPALVAELRQGQQKPPRGGSGRGRPSDRSQPSHRAAVSVDPGAARLRAGGRQPLRPDPAGAQLGSAYLSSLGLPTSPGRTCSIWPREVDESTSVSVLDGDDIVYVARVADPADHVRQHLVGTRFPAYAASMGRVLLAGLDEADARGLPGPGLQLMLLTNRTVRTPDALRAELVKVRATGLGAGRPGTGDRPASLAAPVHDARVGSSPRSTSPPPPRPSHPSRCPPLPGSAGRDGRRDQR